METTNETVAPSHYNPNQLVTYKVIADGSTTYPTTKVSDIEWALESYRKMKETAFLQISKIQMLEESLSGWIENANDAETIVTEICEIFGFNPTKEVEFEATAVITGTVRVPLSELGDFNIEDIDLNVYVDSHSHDVDVDIEVDNITIA